MPPYIRKRRYMQHSVSWSAEEMIPCGPATRLERIPGLSDKPKPKFMLGDS